MKTSKYKIIVVLGSVLLFSCGNPPRSNSTYAPVYDFPKTEIEEGDVQGVYDEYSDIDVRGTSNFGNIRLTGKIVQCNKCMGYGMIQDGMYGQPQICKFYWISTNMRIQKGWTGFDGRYGQVDAVFNTLPLDYFDGLNWSTEGENNAGGTSAAQIESEIASHEVRIAQLEHQLEYIEGSISRVQIQQQIIEEQYEIRRLKAILNSM